MTLIRTDEIERMRRRLRPRRVLRGDENIQSLRALGRMQEMAEGDVFDPNTQIAGRSLRRQEEAVEGNVASGVRAIGTSAGPPTQRSSPIRGIEFNRKARAAGRPTLAERKARRRNLRQTLAEREIARAEARRGGPKTGPRIGPLGLPLDRPTPRHAQIATDVDRIPRGAVADRQVVETPDGQLHRYSAKSEQFLPVQQEPVTGQIVLDTEAIDRQEFVRGLSPQDVEFYSGLLEQTDAGAPYARALRPLRQRRAAAQSELATGAFNEQELDHLQSIADETGDQIGRLIYDAAKAGAAGPEAVSRYAGRLKMGQPQMHPEMGMVSIVQPNGTVRMIKLDDRGMDLVSEARKNLAKQRADVAGVSFGQPITDQDLRDEVSRIVEQRQQDRRVAESLEAAPADDTAAPPPPVAATAEFFKRDGELAYRTSSGRVLPARKIRGFNHVVIETLEDAAELPIGTMVVTPSGKRKFINDEIKDKLTRVTSDAASDEPAGRPAARRSGF